MNWRWSLVLALLASSCGKSSKPRPADDAAVPIVHPDGDDGSLGAQWDGYVKKVDGVSYAIALDLQYRDTAPPASADTLYSVRITLLEPTQHGVGTAAETAAHEQIEEAIRQPAAAVGLTEVGWVKHHGVIDLAFYGPARQLDALRAIVQAAPLGGRRAEVDATADPGWSHYQRVLVPDPERLQWIADRRVVDVLRAEGDALSTPRRVDHWLYFPTRQARSDFLFIARVEGFEVAETTDDNDPPNVHGVQVFRTDPVEVDAIHAAVMLLIALAEVRGGDYDGWETEIVKP